MVACDYLTSPDDQSCDGDPTVHERRFKSGMCYRWSRREAFPPLQHESVEFAQSPCGEFQEEQGTHAPTLSFFACCFGRERVERGWDAGEVVPNLWLGSAIALESTKELKARGITTVVTVSNTKRRAPPQVLQIHVHLNDRVDADFLGSLPTSLNAIDEALDAHRGRGAVLVHCSYGVSRSAATCVAWLIARQGLSLAEAMGVVRKARSIARNLPR